MKRSNERGAIVVEATISLTAFVFAIFTILTLVNVYYIQARMSIALNSAAKEVSQYSYLYYALGIDKYDADASAGTEESKLTAENTIDGVGTMLDSLSGVKNGAASMDIDGMMESIENGTKTVESLIDEYASELSEDPKGFILGMGKMALSELKEEGKVFLGQILAKTFMQKNLKAYKDDDPDAFLKRYRVVDGMAGLDFNYSSLMAYGTSNEIQLCVTYDVEVIQLLNVPFTFTFRQVARTTSWGNGISQITPENNADNSNSVWDLPPTTRGKALVLEEKKNYTYTASGNGFDAYNNKGGANEFITIMSADTFADSNVDGSGIKKSLKDNYNKMEKGVSKLDESIVVQNKNGATTTVTSNKDTRTYKIVLIVPDNSDMAVVNNAVNEFKASHPGVVVEINTKHGSATPPKAETEQEDPANGT